jgi:2',3'-cyclic-nucleotide 2'-phosphodiesterase/3'-nucleotidase
MGLLRLPAYLKTLDHPCLLLDNGDILQGHVLLDVARDQNQPFPVAPLMNACGYQAMTLGNHDFNYGQAFLNTFVKALDFPVLCANLVDDHDQPIFQSHLIHTIGDMKIGIIGLTTQYIPNWEKPEHIQGYHFKDPVLTAQTLVPKLKQKTDLVVVLYHGGFEADLTTKQPIGRPTLENQGVALSKIKGIDILLTGHQHLPTVFNGTPVILQTPANATHIGVVGVEISSTGDKYFEGALIPLDHPVDETLYHTLKPLEDTMIQWLDRPVATAPRDYLITDPLSARKEPHPLFNWVNFHQLKLTGADLSVTALPNEAPGFKASISIRDIAANFVYPNTIVVLEVTGQIILDALEQTAQYFALDAGNIVINKDYLYPKIEHYNYDVYFPLDVIVDLTQPKRNKVIAIFKGEPLNPTQTYTLSLTNYRASGGGDYHMFKNAKILKEYDVSLFDLVYKALHDEKTFNPVNSTPIQFKY